MTTDIRALCAELVDDLEPWITYGEIEAIEKSHDLIDRARAALAAEPEPLPSNYIDSEHTGQDRELLEIFYAACQAEGGTADEIHLRGIRAVLAATEPEPPADGEVAEFVAQLRRYAEEGTPIRLVPSMVARAADLLSRLAPQSVPEEVSDALIKAECALSDIAEGEPEPNSDSADLLKWSEQRCAETLAIIRPVMTQYKIRTSEWLRSHGRPGSAETLGLEQHP